MHFNTLVARLILAAVALFAAQTAPAQSFPARPITIVVPYVAGGAADLLGRLVGERMARTLGQPVVIDNRPGAGGAIAAQYVARAPADGYTLLLAGSTLLVLQPLVMSKLPYEVKDFTGVGLMAFTPLVLVINASSPYRTVADYVKMAQAHPNSSNFGSSGNGSAMHVAGELFKVSADVDVLHVPYKGSPPALNALLANDVQAVFDIVASAKPFIDAGRLRALAVTSSARSTQLPNVPTLQEAGYKDFELAVRYALVAPKATPRPVIERLNAELNAALRDPSLAAQLKNEALDVMPGPPEAIDAFVKSETAKLAPVIKAKASGSIPEARVVAEHGRST